MAAVLRNALDQLSDEELLRIATAVPHAPDGESPEQQVRRFLTWEGIRPGRTASVELHLLCICTTRGVRRIRRDSRA